MKIKTYNISSLKGNDLKSHTLLIEGNLCIKNAGSIKKAFQSLNIKGDIVTFQFKNIESIDITFIQLIRSFTISLKKAGIETFIKTEFNQDTERLLRNAGFDKTL